MTIDTIVPSTTIETPLLKGPVERVKRVMRERKGVVDSISQAVEQFAEECSKVVSSSAQGREASSSASTRLDLFITTLQGFKRKVADMNSEDEVQLSKCRARMEHLALLTAAAQVDDPSPSAPFAKWRREFLNRLIVDHMLRQGYTTSAKALVQSADIQRLVEVEVFEAESRVVEALRQRRSCSEALDWCRDNAPRLKKLKSDLEFKLRRMQFLELVRAGDLLGAVKHARLHLAPHAHTHSKEMQQALATLLYDPESETSPYKWMFCASQWSELICDFQKESRRLNHLTLHPLLALYVQAGLQALKTPSTEGSTPTPPWSSGSGGPVSEDPLADDSCRQLAQGLPCVKQGRSKLLCHLSRAIMNEHNPPMVLPNGYVYSLSALEEMARKNEGKLICPRTGDECDFSDVRKAFIS